MVRVVESPLPALLGHQVEQYGPCRRRRRLGEAIIGGFDSLLRRSRSISNSSGASQGRAIDRRGAGYVVWVPRREQLRQEQQEEVGGGREGVWDERVDGEEEEEEEEEEEQESGGCTPVVLYGGGHGGLFTVRRK